MHPVYEYQTKTEEGYVIEAIATVGEISRHLPWSRYNNTLQSVLNNLPRYPDQERFLVAMMCSIIDGFHFSVETGKEESGQSPEGNGVSRPVVTALPLVRQTDCPISMHPSFRFGER